MLCYVWIIVIILGVVRTHLECTFCQLVHAVGSSSHGGRWISGPKQIKLKVHQVFVRAGLQNWNQWNACAPWLLLLPSAAAAGGGGLTHWLKGRWLNGLPGGSRREGGVLPSRWCEKPRPRLLWNEKLMTHYWHKLRCNTPTSQQRELFHNSSHCEKTKKMQFWSKQKFQYKK